VLLLRSHYNQHTNLRGKQHGPTWRELLQLPGQAVKLGANWLRTEQSAGVPVCSAQESMLGALLLGIVREACIKLSLSDQRRLPLLSRTLHSAGQVLSTSGRSAAAVPAFDGYIASICQIQVSSKPIMLSLPHDDVYYRLPWTLKLLPDLQLDTLTVLGGRANDTAGGPSQVDYTTIDEMVEHGTG
jgi:hypothetical protein